MIDILAHVVQVVVFASSPDAFLGIGSSAQLCHRVRRVNSVQEDGFELKKRKGTFQRLKSCRCYQVVTHWQEKDHTQTVQFVI